MRGKFITFEGSEGSGKSTQINLVHRYLKKSNRSVLFVREPGGVKISEKIRNILLDVQNEGMCDETETLLYMAARAQLVHEVIYPALERGDIVICDRFLDSTVVYQGYGSGVDVKFIKDIGNIVTKGIQPDLTIIFDIDAQEGLKRIKRKKDRIELKEKAYHQKVREGYNDIAKKEPERIKLIKVNKPKEEVFEVVQQYIDEVLEM